MAPGIQKSLAGKWSPAIKGRNIKVNLLGTKSPEGLSKSADPLHQGQKEKKEKREKAWAQESRKPHQKRGHRS